MVMYLAPVGENGEPKTDAETPIYGEFLDMEIGRLGGVEWLPNYMVPLLCRLGAPRTAKNKRLDRMVVLSGRQVADK